MIQRVGSGGSRPRGKSRSQPRPTCPAPRPSTRRGVLPAVVSRPPLAKHARTRLHAHAPGGHAAIAPRSRRRKEAREPKGERTSVGKSWTLREREREIKKKKTLIGILAKFCTWAKVLVSDSLSAPAVPGGAQPHCWCQQCGRHNQAPNSDQKYERKHTVFDWEIRHRLPASWEAETSCFSTSR